MREHMFLTTLPDCVYAVKKIAVLLHKQILLSRFIKNPDCYEQKKSLLHSWCIVHYRIHCNVFYRKRIQPFIRTK